MTQMIAKSLPEYAGEKLVAGDRFECEPGHVDFLAKIGLAELPREGSDANCAPAASSKRGRKQPALDCAKA
jgi:hypothetical protein